MEPEEPSLIRVLIVDDHAIVREGIKRLLETTPDIRIVGEASTGEELLARALEDAFDVALLDLQMPGIGGIEALREIVRINRRVGILVFSMHAEQVYAVRALREGAAGYLSKSAPPNRVLDAIRTVASGRRFIAPDVAEALAAYVMRDASRPSHESLSQREFEVFLRLAQGRTTTEIAGELALSVKTVSTYRARVLEKLGVRSNAELVRYALEAELIT
ncbi:MAG: response regulator transcription factor [Actinobacteria bacterium]|nr:response regulator transcription factor [Actinomycetota bacterium]